MDLYLSNDLRVTYRDVPEAPRSLCVVTFDSFNDLGTLDRSGFGEGFFLSRGIPTVHVISRQNNWYQEPDLPIALDAIRAVTAGFGRAITYGSSMGGYGAIRFGATVGASTAVAISPQYSIDPREVDFEPRWAMSAQSIRFRHRLEDFPRVGQVVVFYDPYDRDRLHTRLIARSYPTIEIRIPYAGHPVGSYLGETGLLVSTVEAICAGTFDPMAVEAEARRLRRQSGQYLFSLARRTSLRRMDTKLALARLAVKANPSEATYASYLATVLDRLGHWEEAEGLHLSAVTSQPGQPHLLEAYSRFLARQARFEEATEFAGRAFAVAPGVGFVARAWLLCLLAAGRWRDATSVAGNMLGANRAMLFSALRDARKVALYRAFGWGGGRVKGRRRAPVAMAAGGEARLDPPSPRLKRYLRVLRSRTDKDRA